MCTGDVQKDIIRLCGAQMSKLIFIQKSVKTSENQKSYFSCLDQVSVPSNGHHQHEEAQRLRGEKQEQSGIKIFFHPHANLLLSPLHLAPL